MPLVSVIMPTYNQDRYLAEAVDSVLGQSLRDLELIVVNDGSTDGTARVLDGYRDEPRLHVVDQENRGASAAMNRGFAASSGSLLTWLASDNRFEPEFLERCARRLGDDSGLGLVYTDFENVDADGAHIDTVRLSPWHPGLLLVDPGALGVGFLYRREVYEAVGDYLDLVCNDLDYWLRAERGFRFAHLPEVLAVNRKHGAMQTVVRRNELLAQVEERLRHELERPGTIERSDPSLLAHARGLGNAALRFVRAFALRAGPGPKRVLLVGHGALAPVAASALGAAGHAVRMGEPGGRNRSEPGEICLALDADSFDGLRRDGETPLRLDSDHAPGTLAGF